MIIGGEEKGVSSMIVPISSTIKKVASQQKSSIPMVKIKGDNLMFGLRKDAMLRVLVSVSKVQPVEKAEVEVPKSVVVDRDSSDSVVPKSGSSHVDSMKVVQVADSKEEIKPSHAQHVGRGLLFEEPERQEKPDAFGSWNVDTAEETDIPVMTMTGLDETAASLHIDIAPTQTDDNISRGADNTMSLCVLGAILGFPAPSCVKKHGRKNVNADFWDLEDGIDDEVPDLPVDEDTDPPDKEGSNRNDEFATASVLDLGDGSDGASETDDGPIVLEDLDIVPDVHNLDQCGEYDSAFYEPSIKKAVDSDIPSLADTDESPFCSPQRRQRDYKFNDSLGDHELLPQIEAMANRIENCPYCELLCCQEFPCSVR